VRALVAKSVDAYVAQYDSAAAVAELLEFRGMDKEIAVWDALRYKQAVGMLRYHV
jgi:soluble P-type ATPase